VIGLEELAGYYEPYLRREGLNRDDLAQFLTLRQELFEIDTRFSEVGERGLFDALDAAGELRHRVVDPGSIERATAEPPRGSRASLRGDYIRRAWGGKTRQLCSWQAVWNMETKQTLDLSDPFASSERWIPSRPPPTLFGRRLPTRRDGSPPDEFPTDESPPPDQEPGESPPSDQSPDESPVSEEDRRFLRETLGF